MKNKKRIIEIEVNDEYIVGSGVVIGAAGSHSDVIMRVKFNKSWVGLSITAVFRNANGEDPTAVITEPVALTALSTLKESNSDFEVHEFTVPPGVKKYEGKVYLSFSGHSVMPAYDEDGDLIYEEAAVTSSGIACFNVLKSGTLMANELYPQAANPGSQLHNDVNTLGTLYGHLSGALDELSKLQEQFKTPSFTVLDLSEVQNAIEEINDFLKYEHENEDELGKENIFGRVYPVGSIYMSVDSTSPALLFGGTWERLENKFLLGANDSNAGAEAGNSSHNHSAGTLRALFSGDIYATNKFHYKTTEEIKGWHPNMMMTVSSGSGSDTSYRYTGIEVEGSTSSTNHMPPYLAVYMWKRTA